MKSKLLLKTIQIHVLVLLLSLLLPSLALAQANDNCANATPIACGGSASGSTTTATLDGPAASCTGGSVAADVWYTITGTGGDITASLCGGGTNYDSKLDVYTGACGALTNIGGCNDDFCGLQSQMTWTSSLGVVYRIRVHGFGGSTGNFTLNVTCAPVGPANDACANAILITCGQTIVGTTTGANLDGASGCGNSNTAPGVWYSYIGTGGSTIISLCGGTNYDSKLTVFSGTCTGGITCVVGNDDFCGLASEVTFISTPGLPYLVLVHGFGAATGNFTLNVTCAGPPPCIVLPTSPTNGQANLCPGATNLSWPASAGATSYDVYFGTTAVPPFVANVITTNYNAGTLAPGTYFWRIAPRNSTGPNISCSNWTFTVAICVPPCVALPTSPTNGQANLCPVATNLSWPASAGATSYDVYFGTTAVPPFVANVITTTYNAGTLTPGTYFWRIAPRNAAGPNTACSTWSFTVVNGAFTVPPPGASTVACPSQIMQPPAPPPVITNCGSIVTPTGPTIVNAPNPITCEGTRTYTWTYNNGFGQITFWNHVVTVERQPFTIATPNGSALVDCPDDTDVLPVPPVVTSNCGEVLTPVRTETSKPICEGTRTYTFTYTDCEGNTAQWRFTYTVEYQDFIIPISIVGAVECPVNAFEPIPVSVNDNCGNPLTPVGPTVTSTTNAQGCEASRKYEWIYTDCEGNSKAWSQTFLFEYNGDFFAPLDEENYVTCLAYAVQPFPQTLYDYCGLPIAAKLVNVSQDIASSGCTGWRKYSFVYTDCGGHSHPWNFTYYINDNEGPLGTCPSGGGVGGPVSVSVTNLECIEDVPCPADYDFLPKVEELLEAGNYFDVCDGDNVIVTLDSWSDLWECSDPDGNGVYTFGRTYYFRIADHCGNEYASLCEVTYSGACQPLESFRSSDWGISGGAPGTSVSAATTDLQVISTLLGTNPILIGGGSRSIKITDAQCVVDLLPGMGGPGILSNCHQVDCTNGCNPMGVGGMKNALAANAIALTLNMRYNVQYSGLTMANVRNQSLGCIELHPCIYACDANGENCYLRIFDQQGQELQYDYTVGGLLDLTNYFLGGNVNLSTGQSVIYSTGLNQSLMSVNAYWSEGQVATACDAGAGIAPDGDSNKAKPTAIPNTKAMLDFSLAPNPASSEVTFKLAELTEPQAVVFELYNALGQQLLRKDFGKVGFVNEQIDLGGIGNGLYIVSVIAGGERYEQKLVISKD